MRERKRERERERDYIQSSSCQSKSRVQLLASGVVSTMHVIGLKKSGGSQGTEDQADCEGERQNSPQMSNEYTSEMYLRGIAINASLKCHVAILPSDDEYC